MGLISDSMLMLEIKIPQEIVIFLRYFNNIIRCKTASGGSPTKFIFQLSMFLKNRG